MTVSATVCAPRTLACSADSTAPHSGIPHPSPSAGSANAFDGERIPRVADQDRRGFTIQEVELFCDADETVRSPMNLGCRRPRGIGPSFVGSYADEPDNLQAVAPCRKHQLVSEPIDQSLVCTDGAQASVSNRCEVESLRPTTSTPEPRSTIPGLRGSQPGEVPHARSISRSGPACSSSRQRSVSRALAGRRPLIGRTTDSSSVQSNRSPSDRAS